MANQSCDYAHKQQHFLRFPTSLTFQLFNKKLAHHLLTPRSMSTSYSGFPMPFLFELGTRAGQTDKQTGKTCNVAYRNITKKSKS